jgi:hypothetical protein
MSQRAAAPGNVLPEPNERLPTMPVERIEDFQALEPFFRVIEDGLAGLVDGGHFFDLLADDVVFEFIITVPGYPRRIAGRDNLIDLYRGYHNAFFLDRCFDLRTTGPTTPLSRLSTRQKAGRRDRTALRQPLHLGRHPQGS